MLNTYIPVQTMIWWLEHSIVVLWIVRNASSLHPFGSKRKNKIIIHVIFLAAAFLLPLVPIISAVRVDLSWITTIVKVISPAAMMVPPRIWFQVALDFKKSTYILSVKWQTSHFHFTLTFGSWQSRKELALLFLILIFYQLWKVNFVNECLWFLHS